MALTPDKEVTLPGNIRACHILTQSLRRIILWTKRDALWRRNISWSKCHCCPSQEFCSEPPSAPWDWANRDKEKKHWSFSRVLVFPPYNAGDRCGPCIRQGKKLKGSLRRQERNLIRILVRLHTNEMLHMGSLATFQSTDLNSTERGRKREIVYFNTRRKLDRSF